MSASLVGSEMCIRDSEDIDRAEPIDGAAHDGNPTDRTEDLALRNSDAVSYTHLTLPTICSV
eukprot:14401600-Alexandrium_andersonii.AAC.1